MSDKRGPAILKCLSDTSLTLILSHSMQEFDWAKYAQICKNVTFSNEMLVAMTLAAQITRELFNHCRVWIVDRHLVRSVGKNSLGLHSESIGRLVYQIQECFP